LPMAQEPYFWIMRHVGFLCDEQVRHSPNSSKREETSATITTAGSRTSAGHDMICGKWWVIRDLNS
jgi:hypothetical protein